MVGGVLVVGCVRVARGVVRGVVVRVRVIVRAWWGLLVRDDLIILWGRWRWIERRRWWLIVRLRDLEMVEE